MESSLLGLEVWGDLACFSRPELKVERLSYPCITPSAARGIFDAVYVKPTEFRWQVRRIEVLAEPRFIALRRNEVKDKVNSTAVARWMKGLGRPEPIWADGDRDLLRTDEKGRTQRQTIALRDVRYRLWAEVRPWPGCGSSLPAFEDQFRRRARAGKCFHQPYLGCREFPAYFRLVEEPNEADQRYPLTLDLGLVLYDVFDLSQQGGSEDAASPSLFHAQIRGGVLDVPAWEEATVLKGETS